MKKSMRREKVRNMTDSQEKKINVKSRPPGDTHQSYLKNLK